MPFILKKHHAKYKVNTTENKEVTKLMSPFPTDEGSPELRPGPIDFYFQCKPEPGNERESGVEPGIELGIEP